MSQVGSTLVWEGIRFFLNIHMFVSKCNRTPGWNLTRVLFVLFLSQTQRNQRPSSGDWGTGGQVNLPLWAVIFFPEHMTLYSQTKQKKRSTHRKMSLTMFKMKKSYILWICMYLFLLFFASSCKLISFSLLFRSVLIQFVFFFLLRERLTKI